MKGWDEFTLLSEDYRHPPLLEQALPEDPLRLFQQWLDEAIAAKVHLPHAMALATADSRGQPSARIVLLKEVSERGLVFFTNYESRKGQELVRNSQASLLFWWGILARQVRLEGEVERVTAEESDAYFASRPPASNWGAMASPQSQVVSDRAELEARVARVAAEAGTDSLVRPAHWGGYRLRPAVWEFWQGRPDRLHDRFRYRAEEAGRWVRERLAP